METIIYLFVLKLIHNRINVVRRLIISPIQSLCDSKESFFVKMSALVNPFRQIIFNKPDSLNWEK